MNYEDAKKIKNDAYLTNEKAAKTLREVPGVSSGSFGLTPDHIKATPEYQHANRVFNVTFARMRNTNQWFNKTFKKEYAAERKELQRQREVFGSQIKGE